MQLYYCYDWQLLLLIVFFMFKNYSANFFICGIDILCEMSFFFLTPPRQGQYCVFMCMRLIYAHAVPKSTLLHETKVFLVQSMQGTIGWEIFIVENYATVTFNNKN